MKKPSSLAFILLLTGLTSAYARPLVTEDISNLGPGTFETTLSLSRRSDAFNSPKVDYRTVDIPVRARIGIFRRLDLGFSLSHLSHSLESGGEKLKGSRPALFSPEIKYTFNDYVGVLGIWHVGLSEKSGQNLPISRGDDFEFLSLFKAPVKWPTYLNVGYVFRESYTSRFGVEGGPISTVKPGDIFETRASVEIPVRYFISILTEAAYYYVGKRQIAGVGINNSEGSAADALVGLVWENKGWNIGAGVGFGLLDESHTSFDLERGAGDVQYRFSVAYKLKPRKPNL